MALRRVFVEGYTTCGYYQGALELWRKVESIPKNNIKVITTQRSRGEYMNWLEKKSKELGKEWSTSPFVVIEEEGKKPEVVGGADDSYDYVAKHFKNSNM